MWAQRTKHPTLLNGVSHCVFAIPGNQFCTFTCSGMVDATKQLLVKRYMTAWLNYYLLYKTEDYTYLYGTQSEADVSAGLIVKQENTAPRNFTASPATGAVELAWTIYSHPSVAGYNIYRRQAGQSLRRNALRAGRRGAELRGHKCDRRASLFVHTAQSRCRRQCASGRRRAQRDPARGHTGHAHADTDCDRHADADGNDSFYELCLSAGDL